MDIQEAIEQPRFATFSFPNSRAPLPLLLGRDDPAPLQNRLKTGFGRAGVDFKQPAYAMVS
jgi:hypothetical protein